METIQLGYNKIQVTITLDDFDENDRDEQIALGFDETGSIRSVLEQCKKQHISRNDPDWCSCDGIWKTYNPNEVEQWVYWEEVKEAGGKLVLDFEWQDYEEEQDDDDDYEENETIEEPDNFEEELYEEDED